MKEFIKIPTSVVRNESVNIDSGTFVLYVRLCEKRHRNYKMDNPDKIVFYHFELIKQLNIKDNRTLKRMLSNLEKNGLVKDIPVKYPRHFEAVSLTLLNMNEKGCHFTIIKEEWLNKMDVISPAAFRLLVYYKSHINPTRGRDFCFTGKDTIIKSLKIGGTTLVESNKELEKLGLLEIKRHDLRHDGYYDENDRPYFSRFQNHYYVK